MGIEATQDPDWFDEDRRSPYEWARDWLITQAEAGAFEWVKVKTLDTLLRHFDSCWQAFLTDVLPKLGEPVSIEQSFDLPLVVAPDGTRIRLAGTWDYEDGALGLLDWKTAGRPWERGKHKRRVQTAAYTWAWATLNNDYLNRQSDPEVSFTYVVHIKGATPSKPQFLTDHAGPDEWRWLQELALRVYDNMQADSWALNDTTPLCSAKWCDYWDSCKGATIGQPLLAAA